MELLIGGFLVFLARLVNVSIGTVRTLIGLRGRKFLATTLGFFESLIYILAVGHVLQDVGNVWNILGYCGGFACGTLLGLFVEEKLALGYAIVEIISKNSKEITGVLRQEGYGVTEVIGEGLNGQVRVATIAARRRDTHAIMALVNQIDATAFVVVDNATRIYRGHLEPA